MSLRVIHRLGRRGAALLFFAGLDGVIAWSLLSPDTPLAASYAYAATVAPLWAWGTLWGVCAGACAVNAFRRVDRVGFGAAMGVKALWGLLLAGGSLTGHIPRGLIGAAVWLTFAAFVLLLSTWPEPTHGATQ